MLILVKIWNFGSGVRSNPPPTRMKKVSEPKKLAIRSPKKFEKLNVSNNHPKIDKKFQNAIPLRGVRSEQLPPQGIGFKMTFTTLNKILKMIFQ